MLLAQLVLLSTLMSFLATSSCTLISRTKVPTNSGNSGYPYNQEVQREKISNLPGGFKYASSNLAEFQTPFVIRLDDPHAGVFAGRWAGGGTRLDICGNQRYGSGYPGYSTEGVRGRNFPFFFYPISYGSYPGYGPTYIYDYEYGGPGNKSRPGGPLYYISIQPAKSLEKGSCPEVPPMDLYVIADKPTLEAVGPAVLWSCSKNNYNGWIGEDKVRISKPKEFKGPAEDPKGPVPEQAVSYYRGSSVALSLVGYNNTAQVTSYTPGNPTSQVDTPFPPVVDSSFFMCVNRTLGESIPLVIGSAPYQANAASSITTPRSRLVTLLALDLVILLIVF